MGWSEDDVRFIRIWGNEDVGIWGYGIWEYDDVRVMRIWGNEDYEGIWGYKWGGLTLGG